MHTIKLAKKKIQTKVRHTKPVVPIQYSTDFLIKYARTVMSTITSARGDVEMIIGMTRFQRPLVLDFQGTTEAEWVWLHLQTTYVCHPDRQERGLYLKNNKRGGLIGRQTSFIS